MRVEKKNKIAAVVKYYKKERTNGVKEVSVSGRAQFSFFLPFKH